MEVKSSGVLDEIAASRRAATKLCHDSAAQMRVTRAAAHDRQMKEFLTGGDGTGTVDHLIFARSSVMGVRATMVCALAAAVYCTATFGQEAAGGNGAIGGAVEREVKGLTSQDFPEREAALKRLETLIAEQVKQRAAIQDVVLALQKDLAKQEQALAMVTDEEAQAQVAGLLELERGLAGFTIQTMSEPAEKRKALLAWGLSKEGAGIVSKVYSDNKRARVSAIKDLAKLEDESAGWTLGRLINDSDDMVRASAMAAVWGRKPQADVVAALWFRAITGPEQSTERERMGRGVEGEGMQMKVDFPEGEPLEFFKDDGAEGFTDALLAGSVLCHLQSPLVEEKVKALVALRTKQGKTLASMEDPDWTLATHRLVEAYMVKEAVPLLATEALGMQSEEMGGDFNGRPFMWSQRTMAIGVLMKLLGKDPGDFGLVRARDNGELRGWQWGTEINPANQNANGAQDGAAVTAFYTWWKAHHAEYGVKDEPGPNPIQPRRGRRGGVPMPFNGPGVEGGAPGNPGVGGPAVDQGPVDLPGDAPVEIAPRPRGRGAG